MPAPDLIPLFGLREPVSSLSHLVTAVIGVLGHLQLARAAVRRGVSARRRAELHVYGIAIILLFAASGLYHGVDGSAARVDWFKRLDHASIFVLIAASTTAVIGVSPGRFGRVVTVLTWLAGFAGMCIQLFGWPPLPSVSAGTYVVAATLSLLGIGCLLEERANRSLLPVIAGGIFYVAGVAVYLMDTLVLLPGYLHGHELFHILVIGGASSHFLFVYRYLCETCIPEPPPEPATRGSGRVLVPSLLLAATLLSLSGCARPADSPAPEAVAQVSGSQPDAGSMYEVRGRVVSLPGEGRFVVVRHGPIDGFMDGMTMPFQLADSVAAPAAPGDSVAFRISVASDGVRAFGFQVF